MGAQRRDIQPTLQMWRGVWSGRASWKPWYLNPDTRLRKSWLRKRWVVGTLREGTECVKGWRWEGAGSLLCTGQADGESIRAFTRVTERRCEKSATMRGFSSPIRRKLPLLTLVGKFLLGNEGPVGDQGSPLSSRLSPGLLNWKHALRNL